MSNSKKDEALEGMRYALENQIRWQHYAEAKNLGLLTISGATLGMFLSPLQSVGSYKSTAALIEHLMFGSKFGWVVFFLAAVSSFVVALSSFYVRITKEDDESSDAHLYLISWRFINNYKGDDLLAKVKNYDKDAQLRDLLKQHKMGSKLTQRKYSYYNWGYLIYVGGLLLFTITSLESYLLPAG